VKNFALTKTDTDLFNDVATEFEMDLIAVFNILQADVLKILEEESDPDVIISKIEKLLG